MKNTRNEIKQIWPGEPSERTKPMNKLLIVGLLLLSMFAVGIAPVNAQTYEQARKEQIQKAMKTSDGVQIKNSVNKYSKMYGVEPNMIYAIMLTESGFNKNAVSPGNCIGLMQLSSSTFRARNVGTNIYNIDQNIHAGTKHYAGLLGRYRGNSQYALAAYNYGGAKVILNKPIPQGAQRYVNKVYLHKQIIESVSF